MKKILFDNNRVKSLESIESEEDLELGPGICIEPATKTVKCDCCGRDISELKPFSKADFPSIGDFDGALLIRNFREISPWDEETEWALEEACICYQRDGYKDILAWMVDKYGKEKAEKFYAAEVHGTGLFKSWECRDCIMLDDDEYFERRNQAQNERAQALSESHDGSSNCS